MELNDRYSVNTNDDILRMIFHSVDDLMALRRLTGINRRFRRLALQMLPEALRLKFCAVLECLLKAPDLFDTEVAKHHYTQPEGTKYHARKVEKKIINIYKEQIVFNGTDVVQLRQEACKYQRALLEMFKNGGPLVQVKTKSRREFVPMLGYVRVASFEESSIAEAFCMANGLRELTLFAGYERGLISRISNILTDRLLL